MTQSRILPALAATLLSFSALSFSAMASEIEIVTGDHIPALGPYVPATVYNGVVYTAGQIALDNKTKKVVGDDVTAQTRKTLENLSAVLEAAGSSLEHTLRITIFLQNPEDFPAMNEVYLEFFPDHQPARTTVPGVAWGHNILVEIDAIAVQVKNPDQDIEH